MRGPQPARTQRARALRDADNDAEKALRTELKGRRLGGHRFTRQLPIGPYFADFACRGRRLIVEVDGSQHAGSRYDAARDSYILERGWSVLRFWNTDIFKDLQAVIDTTLAALEERLDAEVRTFDLRFRKATASSHIHHPPFEHLLPVNGGKE